MFGIKEIERAMESLGDKVARATVEGIEKGAKILGDTIAAKMDELHERDREKPDNSAEEWRRIDGG
jgi:hypothetical protein